MKRQKTERGFALYEFQDTYGLPCSLQKSSSAEEDRIWFGISDPKPIIMASKTKEGGTGWVPFKIPEDVCIHTRMHLSIDLVKKLLPILNKFVKTGEV
jgi:hypothetical protein